jgi:hypothetical protein
VIHNSSKTQAFEAQSSGEAELGGIHRGGVQSIFAQNLLREFGVDPTIEVCSDSVAGIAMASRLGVGGVRHLDLKQLWIQGQVRAGRLKLRKIAGESNPADIGTKVLDQAKIVMFLKMLSFSVAVGALMCFSVRGQARRQVKRMCFAAALLAHSAAGACERPCQAEGVHIELHWKTLFGLLFFAWVLGFYFGRRLFTKEESVNNQKELNETGSINMSKDQARTGVENMTGSNFHNNEPSNAHIVEEFDIASSVGSSEFERVERVRSRAIIQAWTVHDSDVFHLSSCQALRKARGDRVTSKRLCKFCQDQVRLHLN